LIGKSGYGECVIDVVGIVGVGGEGLTGKSSGLDAVDYLGGVGTIVWFDLGGWVGWRRGKEEGEVGFLGC